MNRYSAVPLVLFLLTVNWLGAQEESTLDIPAYVITAQDREVLSVPYGLELLVSSAESLINEPIAIPPAESSQALEVAVEGVEFPPADLDRQRSGLFRLANYWRSTGTLENQAQWQLQPPGWDPGLTFLVDYYSLQDTLLEQGQVQKMELGLAGGFSLPFFGLSFTQKNYIEYSQASALMIPRLQAGLGLCLESLTLSSQLFSGFQSMESFYIYHQSRLNLDLGLLALELEQSDMTGPGSLVSTSHLASASLVFGKTADSWLVKAGASLDYSGNLLFYPRLELGLFFNRFFSMGLSAHYTKEYPGLLGEFEEEAPFSFKAEELSRLFYTMKLHVQDSRFFESFLRFSYVQGESRSTQAGALDSVQGQWLWLQVDGSLWPAKGLELKARFDGDFDLNTAKWGAAFETAFYINWPDFMIFGPGGGYAVVSEVYSPYWIFDYADVTSPLYFFFDIKLPWEKHIDFESRLGIYINQGEFAAFGQIQLVLSF